MSGLTPAKRLQLSHKEDRQRGLTGDQISQIKRYVLRYMQDLALHSQGILRQRVVAVACTFMRRFYIRHDFWEYDPRLVGPACLYLASKTEESLIQAKVLFHYMRKISGQHPIPIPDMKQLLDLEMALMEELDFQLITETPYDALLQMLKQLKCTDIAQPAWGALNDSYKTDLCLTHSPAAIALACVVLACSLHKKELPEDVINMKVNLDQVYGAAMRILHEPGRLAEVGALTCSSWIASLGHQTPGETACRGP